MIEKSCQESLLYGLNVATEKMKIVTTFTDTEQLVMSGSRAENPDIFWMIMIENKWRAIVTK